MESLKRLTLWQKRMLAAVAGGLAGYAYYYYIGCASGTCPITSNPYISVVYGMVMAGLLVNDDAPKGTKENGNTARQEV